MSEKIRTLLREVNSKFDGTVSIELEPIPNSKELGLFFRVHFPGYPPELVDTVGDLHNVLKRYMGVIWFDNMMKPKP